MKSAVTTSKRIEAFCLRYPSEATRAAFRSELHQANRHLSLKRWDSVSALARMRELQTQVSTRTLILKFQRLHTYFRWEIEQGYRKQNPIDLKALPKLRDMRAPQALTTDEVHQLLRVIPKATWHGARDHLAVSLMLVHGYRISTIVGMNWEHLVKRSDGVYLQTNAKNGVLTSRKLRPDVSALVCKFQKFTEASRC